MHTFIHFIFFEVWCRAPRLEYSLELFKGDSDLYEIMQTLERYDLAGRPLKGADFFLKGVNGVFLEFKGLSAQEIDRLKTAFQDNNDLERCCNGQGPCLPLPYDTLSSVHPTLVESFRNFFGNLYSQGFLGLEIFARHIGTVDAYYDSFISKNNQGVCPFCGLQPMDGEWDLTREPLDHYLPKSKYPFNSINLKNLPPACHKCNSQYKLGADPVHDRNQNRRKAFYPFSPEPFGIEVNAEIRTQDWTNLKPENFTFSFGPASRDEEIQTWVEIYRVNERYAARCCSRNGGIGWLNTVVAECAQYGNTRKEMLEALVATASRSPWHELNFLKKAFLEGIQNAGVDLDSIPS
jgi:hypothetical protein